MSDASAKNRPLSDDDGTSADANRDESQSTRGFVPSKDAAARLVDILDGYMADLKAGHPPSREQLLSANPDLATQLDACLAGIDFIHRAESADAGSPAQLGDFRIIRLVGRGGMGTVYEAEQISLGRRVALKVLRVGTISDPEAIERFQREAETVAQLHHTNIVPIYSVGSEAGVNYYAMQFVDGRSLADELADRGRPIDADTVARWGLEAAEALAHAHARDVVHRDVKPSNLMLDEQGRIWLTDFGLARRLGDVTLSMTGALLGTPRYMSPEQASATARRVDHRTDIYSLGATLYELLTATPAFAGDTPHGVISQILSAEPESVRQREPSVPRDMDTIVMKCLAKDPAGRYASAQELVADLRAFLEDRPIRARRPSLVELGARWLRKQKRSVAVTTAAVAATLLLILMTLGGWYGYHRRQVSWLTLRADSPPMIAEILNEQGDPLIEPLTVPTQGPLELPAGDYQLRFSGEGRLSQTYDVELARRQRTELKLSLNDQLAREPIAVRRRYQIVQLDGRAHVVLLDDDGTMVVDVAGDGTHHGHGLGYVSYPEVPGLRWPWLDTAWLRKESGFGKFDLCPRVLDPAVDLDGDGQDDVILAARHQAWILAWSEENGRLWLVGRGDDVTTSPKESGQETYSGVRSAVLGVTADAGDINGDGVPDLVATFGDIGTVTAERAGEAQTLRWVEALSGASGQTLWRYDLNASLFALPSGAEAPYEFRWFTGTGQGTSTRGGPRGRSVGIDRRGQGQLGWHYGGSGWIRSGRSHTVRQGNHVYVPSQPRIVQHLEKQIVAVVAGTFLVTLDLMTGEPADQPQDIGLRPGVEPIWANLEGDETTELVLLENPKPDDPSARQVRLGVWSLAEGKRLWAMDLPTYWPGPQDFARPPPAWPVVEDLDGDGRCELIVPDGGTDYTNNFRAATSWNSAELAVLDGQDGRERWRQRIFGMEDAVEHFVVGPDINGDGHREVYVASLSARPNEVFVDAFSGGDGSRLWFAREHLRGVTADPQSLQIASFGLWDAGEDGWPQLVMSTGEAICCFSAGTGRVTRFGSGILQTVAADADGDAIDELFTFRWDRRNDGLRSGGELNSVQGVAAERWKGLSGNRQPAADFDQDGVMDLVQLRQVAIRSAELTARSGRTDRPLWRTMLKEVPNTDNEFECQATDRDLDGDGVLDLLVFRHRQNTLPRNLPVQSFSGRTGRTIWTADLGGKWVTVVPPVEIRDLDGDGQLELILVGTMDAPETSQAGDPNDPLPALGMAVVSASNGRLQWVHALTGHGATFPNKSPSLKTSGDVVTGYYYRGVDYQRVEGFTVAFGDLNRDGTQDIVAPSVSIRSGKLSHDLQALSGDNGSLLWRHALPHIDEQFLPEGISTTQPATLTDLNRDGVIEVLVLAIEDVPRMTNSGSRHVAHLRCLSGQSGELIWSWQVDVNHHYTHPGAEDYRFRPRPFILRRAGGPPRICLNLSDTLVDGQFQGDCIFVLDHQGVEVARHCINEKRRGSHWFPLWTCDVQGDGSDELVYYDNDRWVVAPCLKPGHPLWTRAEPGGDRNNILAILPDDGRPAQQIVLERAWVTGAGTKRDVVAVDAANGQVRWSCRGPVQGTVSVGGGFSNRVALLSNPTEDAPPWLFFHYDRGVSVCRQAAWTGVSRAKFAAQVPPQLEPHADDPRVVLRLPWAPSAHQIAEYLILQAWVGFYALTLALIPIAFLYRIIRRRNWGVRTILLAPAIAAIFLVGLSVDGPEAEAGWEFKLLCALFGAPVLWFLAVMVRWMWAQRWWMVIFWTVVVLAMAALAAAGYLMMELEQWQIAEHQRYSTDGWYWILVPALYCAAYLLLVTWPLYLLSQAIWRWLRGATISARPAR